MDGGKWRTHIFVGINWAVVNTDNKVIIEPSKFIDIQLILYILDIPHSSFVLDVHPSAPNVQIEVRIVVDELKFLAGILESVEGLVLLSHDVKHFFFRICIKKLNKN